MVKYSGCRICVRKLFVGANKLTKNADPGKYKYFGYGIGFDTRRSYKMVVVLVKML